MRIDASHEFGAETWEQRARVCAAELEEAKELIRKLDNKIAYLEQAFGEIEKAVEWKEAKTKVSGA